MLPVGTTGPATSDLDDTAHSVRDCCELASLRKSLILPIASMASFATCSAPCTARQPPACSCHAPSCSYTPAAAPLRRGATPLTAAACPIAAQRPAHRRSLIAFADKSRQRAEFEKGIAEEDAAVEAEAEPSMEQQLQMLRAQGPPPGMSQEDFEQQMDTYEKAMQDPQVRRTKGMLTYCPAESMRAAINIGRLCCMYAFSLECTRGATISSKRSGISAPALALLGFHTCATGQSDNFTTRLNETSLCVFADTLCLVLAPAGAQADAGDAGRRGSAAGAGADGPDGGGHAEQGAHEPHDRAEGVLSFGCQTALETMTTPS